MQTAQILFDEEPRTRDLDIDSNRIDKHPMPFSILIPVLNEEKIIVRNTQRLVDFLQKLQSSYEIIIIDNGSNDSTLRKGRFLEEKYPGIVRFLRIDKRGAVGRAFKKGVLSAKYNRIISLDMDLSIDLRLFIPRCLELLDKNSIVVGSKFMRGGSQKRPLLRIFASGTFTVLSRLLLGLQFSDYSMSGKGYRREDIIRDLKKIGKGSSYVIELISITKKKNLNISQIPVHCFDRRSSKFSFVGEALYRFGRLLNFWLIDQAIDQNQVARTRRASSL